MLPLMDSKLQNAYDNKNVGCCSSSWVMSSRNAVHIKEELINSCDTSSRESVEQDYEEPESSSCHVKHSSCSSCGFIFDSKEQLCEHQSICQVDKVNVCNICQENFECRSDLNNHIVCHHVNHLHACRVCGALFRMKADLQSHFVTHQVAKPHKCLVCGTEFQRHSSLANHTKIHSYFPGRALLPSLVFNNHVQDFSNSTLETSFEQPLLCVGQSKEPIPSFETFSSPSYSFQHFVSTSLNQYTPETTWSNAFESKASISKPFDAEPDANPSSLELTLNQGDADFLQKNIYNNMTIGLAMPLLMAEEHDTSSNPSGAHIFGTEPEGHAGGDSDKSLTDPAYLAVKRVGLLYGIKMEETSAPSLPVGEEQTQVDCTQQQPTSSESLNGFREENNHTNLCSKCDFDSTVVEDCTSDVLLQNGGLNCALSLKDPFQSLQSKLVANNETVSDKVATTNGYQSSCQTTIINALSPHGSTVQNKPTLKHVCLECQKKFATKQKLFRHMWIHRKKQFACETCGVVFGERIALDEHRLAFHPPSLTTPFACNECGKTFASRQSLWEHGRVHGSGSSGAALLWCQECNKSFASRQGYQIHVRTHTGERPYGCRYCCKSFRDGGTLRKHERIHTGERPHACPICSRAFNQKVVLREHVRWVHAAATNCEPPFSCQICNMILNDREELCVHIVKHSDDLAAVARAAARKDMSLDQGPKSRTLPKNIQFILPSQDKTNTSFATAKLEKPNNGSLLLSKNMWIDEILRDSNSNNPAKFSFSPDSCQIQENGKRAMCSTNVSPVGGVAKECCNFSPAAFSNENQACRSAVSTFVGEQPRALKDVCFVGIPTYSKGPSHVECNRSISVSVQQKCKVNEDVDSHGLKSDIVFENSIPSALCEMSPKNLANNSAFPENVAIHVQ